MTIPGLVNLPRLQAQTINHYKQKDKWYIKDLVVLGLVKSIYMITKDGNDFDGELVVVHVNKARKQKKKINYALKSFANLRERLLLTISKEDLNKVQKVTKALGPYFFEAANKLEKPNLELVIIHLLYLRFCDLSRTAKNKPHKDFDMCTNMKDIFSIGELLEKVKIKDMGDEYQFAENFIKKLNEV